MKDLLIVAGGTGGHVYPAISLALHLISEGNSVTFLTDRRGINYFDNHHQDILNPVVLPLDRKEAGIRGLVKLTFQFILSFFVSLIYVARVKTVIGFSGFPTFATLMAGLVTGRTLCVHEQNAVLGKVNRWMAPFLKKIFTSTKKLSKVSPKALGKIEFVGMPVRPDIAALSEIPYEMPTHTIHLLITGGSQGAQSFSDVIPKALALLPASLQQRLEVTHQVREADQKYANKIYNKSKVNQFSLVSFVKNMDQAIQKSHLVIARSGASTVSELAAAGRPAILIPYPFATDDHQALNAREVTKRGGGWLIPHKNFSEKALSAFLLDLFDHPKKLLVASQCVRQNYEKNSIKALAQGALFV